MKSIYEEALENLHLHEHQLEENKTLERKFDLLKKVNQALEQAYKQEQEHIEYSKKVQEQFSNDTKRIGELESKLIKQEKLLELYKEKSEILSLFKTVSQLPMSDNLRLIEIDNLLRELEK